MGRWLIAIKHKQDRLVHLLCGLVKEEYRDAPFPSLLVKNGALKEGSCLKAPSFKIAFRLFAYVCQIGRCYFGKRYISCIIQQDGGMGDGSKKVLSLHHAAIDIINIVDEYSD